MRLEAVHAGGWGGSRRWDCCPQAVPFGTSSPVGGPARIDRAREPEHLPMAPMTAVGIVERAGGAVRWGDLRRAGVSRAAIERAVREGHLRRPGPGTLAVPGCRPAVVAAARHRSSLACVSAVAYHGLDVLDQPRKPHLTGAACRVGPPARSGVVWHRGTADGPALAVARAAAQMLLCCTALQSFVALDSILRAGTTAAQISGELGPRAGGSWRWVLGHVDARSGSVLESLLRFHLLRARLRHLDLQVAIPGLGHVDFLLDGWLIVETDGYGSHGDARAFAEDLRRTTIAAEQGYVTVRLGWSDVRDRPGAAVASLRRVLAHGPRGAGPGRGM